MGRDLWTSAIHRAETLADADATAGPLLTFTASLLRAQRDIYTNLRLPSAMPITGALDTDLPCLRPLMLPLLAIVFAQGPETLAAGAAELQAVHPSALDEMLIAYWQAPTDDQFFAKATLQPYARALADAKIRPADRDLIQPDQRCPFCGGLPQLAVLQATDTRADGGRRHLLCASCLTVWPFRRILCAHCGEEDERKLGYFHAANSFLYRHVRVEVCATCRHYLKAVDLADVGLAVPLVDEIAASTLDVWARDQGLTKIERNLVGL